MKILGLSFFSHNSAAALVSDGDILAAISEERFTRQKNTSEFPWQSIDFCLEAGNISSLEEIDAIVFFEKPLRKYLRVLETFIREWPKGFATFTNHFPYYLKNRVNIRSLLYSAFPNYNGPILFSEHHLSHAALSFYGSPYTEAAIITIDGVGEYETASFCIGRGNSIKKVKSLHFPNSVGLFYSSLTRYLGFEVNEGEWRVMALAATGHDTYLNAIRKMISRNRDGSFSLNLKYFTFLNSKNSGPVLAEWENLLGFPKRSSQEPISQKHADLAFAGQRMAEELLLGLAQEAQRVSGLDRLVLGGGVALNCLANSRIEKEGGFKEVWIPPAPGDDGAALGAALHVIYDKAHFPRRSIALHAYLGFRPGKEDCAEALRRARLPFDTLECNDLIERTIDHIVQGDIVGWYQGKMEFGPRALGARSLLADPTKVTVREHLNRVIKEREQFRPFGASIPLENVHEFFLVPPNTPFPFMVKTVKVRESAKSIIPAVVHSDGTCRIQTVTAQDNPLFHKLLTVLRKRTGVPVLLNTSFNLRGEPIVCTPEDAIHCYLRSPIEVLVLENHFVNKKSPMETGPTASEEAVSNFYATSPFNFFSSGAQSAKELAQRNRIKEYPPVHRFLQKRKEAKILDVGCGAGWFVNSVSYYYDATVIGIDKSKKAIREALLAQRFLNRNEKVTLKEIDLFQYDAPQEFDLVNSLGVLHHTSDCQQAIAKVASWTKRGGYIHIGLYHSIGRRPFLDYFSNLKKMGLQEKELFFHFQKMLPEGTPPYHAYSWFKDQLFHPKESLHSYGEIAKLLYSLEFKVEATSLNGYRRLPSTDELVKLEKYQESLGQRAIKRHRFFPGFFTVWAKKQ